MDPIVAFGVAGTSARLATTAWNTGEALSAFIKNAKTVDQTLIALTAQSQAIGELCELITALLQEPRNSLDACPKTARARGGKQLANVMHVIEGQLAACEHTLGRLCQSTQGIKLSNTRLTGRAWAQLKLNFSRESMMESRCQLSLHLLALNASLQAWNINLAASSPETPTDNMEHEIDDRHMQMPQSDMFRTTKCTPEAGSAPPTCLKKASVPEQSSSGPALTSGMEVRQHKLSSNAESPGSSLITIQSAATAIPQCPASCKIGSTTRLTATVMDPQKTKSTSGIQSVGLTEQVNAAAFERALDDAIAMYRIEHYHDARLGFSIVISMVHDLAPQAHRSYDLFGIAYMHAVAAYNSLDHVSARGILMDFVRGQEQSTPRYQRLCLAHVSSLLAIVNIELGELQAAQIACKQAVQLCCSTNSKDRNILDDCIALSARVETLLDNHARMQALINMIDPTRQALLTRFCARYPHRQGLRVEERCALARDEADLFANIRICETTGIATILIAQERVWVSKALMRRLGGSSKPRTRGITSLHLASLFGNADEASALIDQGADIGAEAHVAKFRHLQWAAEQPLTPLACALLLRHGNMVRLLVSKGAKLTTSDGTSIISAIMNEAFVEDNSHSFREMLDTLKLLGWDINSPSASRGRTLLHVAARLSKTAHARTLISCGASVIAVDQCGNIPLHAALRRWREGSRVPEIIRILLQHRMQEQLMSRNHRGMTVLHVVVYGHHPLEQVILFLLKAGADPHAIDALGRSPFNWLQRRWDWTGVSKFLTQNHFETPFASCLDSSQTKIGQVEAVGQFLNTIT